MSKHTPEPWTHGTCGGGRLIVQEGDDPKYCPTFIAATNIPGKAFSPNSEANAARIVACVNACRGLTDPAAELTALRNYVGNNHLHSDYQNADQMRAEIAALREAVKLLGEHIKTLTAERAIFSRGPGLNEWAYAKVAVEESGDRVRNNPIAAAAVRGEP